MKSAVAWGAFTALLVSPFFGLALAQRGVPLLVGIPLTAVAIRATVVGLSNRVAHVGEGVHAAVWGRRGLHEPGPGYSHAESLVARGSYGEALVKYRELAARHPEIPDGPGVAKTSGRRAPRAPAPRPPA